MRAMASTWQMPAGSLDRWPADYERGRPGWPGEAIEAAGLLSTATVLDVGAGTGKLTRLLVRACARFFAVEPAEAMRRELMARCPAADVLNGTGQDRISRCQMLRSTRCSLLRPFIGSSTTRRWHRSREFSGHAGASFSCGTFLRVRGTRRSGLSSGCYSAVCPTLMSAAIRWILAGSNAFAGTGAVRSPRQGSSLSGTRACRIRRLWTGKESWPSSLPWAGSQISPMTSGCRSLTKSGRYSRRTRTAGRGRRTSTGRNSPSTRNRLLAVAQSLRSTKPTRHRRAGIDRQPRGDSGRSSGGPVLGDAKTCRARRTTGRILPAAVLSVGSSRAIRSSARCRRRGGSLRSRAPRRR